MARPAPSRPGAPGPVPPCTLTSDGAPPAHPQTRHPCAPQFKDGTADSDIALFFDEVNAVCVHAGGLKDFGGGKNTCIEGHTDGYTHMFVMTFESDEARKK